jgi:hypothetical protein
LIEEDTNNKAFEKEKKISRKKKTDSNKYFG